MLIGTPLNTIHRAVNCFHGITSNTVLNRSHDAVSLNNLEELDKLFKQVKSSYILSGGIVDYEELSRSETFNAYKQSVSELQKFDVLKLSENEQKAFWLNIYNMLIIDAVISCRVKKSPMEIKGFFWKMAYQIGGYRFSAHDIEQGVLRAGVGHPLVPGPHFPRNDPRRHYMMSNADPRIHFALVCAANSCPPISIYTPQNLDQQLDLAARSFINSDEVAFNPSTLSLSISQIFKWYSIDFTGLSYLSGSKQRRLKLLEFIHQYTDNPELKVAISSQPEKITLEFSPYNWRLNKVFNHESFNQQSRAVEGN